MIYLFLGDDKAAKDLKIKEIKDQYLLTPESRQFDFTVLYGSQMTPDQFKQTLVALPTMAAQRVVLLYSVHKLNPRNKKILLEFLEQKESPTVLILDVDEPGVEKNSFLDKVAASAKIVRFHSEPKGNVFDMTKEISNRRPEQALAMLSGLLHDGDHPLEILGALVWFWGRTRNRVSAEKFKKGLLVLQEADMNIKRSRVEPEYALEILVTKLSLLLAG